MSSADRNILLHTCCAPCATASAERLRQEKYEPVLFFSNSNIAPEAEYQKRLAEAKRFALIGGYTLVEDSYDHSGWLEAIEAVPGFADEPEGGARCAACFRYSLGRTFDGAQSLGAPAFTTTLTISPYKNSELIFSIGKDFAGFLPYNFKKLDGYARSISLSREYTLYRQQYCGCEFSFRS